MTFGTDIVYRWTWKMVLLILSCQITNYKSTIIIHVHNNIVFAIIIFHLIFVPSQSWPIFLAIRYMYKATVSSKRVSGPQIPLHYIGRAVIISHYAIIMTSYPVQFPHLTIKFTTNHWSRNLQEGQAIPLHKACTHWLRLVASCCSGMRSGDNFTSILYICTFINTLS